MDLISSNTKKEVSDTLLNAISKYIYGYAVYTRM